jgi:hypothetical protein
MGGMGGWDERTRGNTTISSLSHTHTHTHTHTHIISSPPPLRRAPTLLSFSPSYSPSLCRCPRSRQDPVVPTTPPPELPPLISLMCTLIIGKRRVVLAAHKAIHTRCMVMQICSAVVAFVRIQVCPT